MTRKSLTKLEREKLLKKRLAEQEERINVLGQESEKKAKKWVIENAKEEEKKQKKKEEDQLSVLDIYRKRRTDYQRFLIYMLHDMILEIRMSTSYQWGVWFDGKGVRVKVVDKYGKSFQRAFRISYSPVHDTNMCYQFALWVEDVYDMLEGSLILPQKEKGIWTPTKKNN